MSNIESDVFSIHQRVFKEIVAKDDEQTKQAIKDYFTEKYPKENVRIDFLDEEIVNQIINLGIAEYLRRKGSDERV